jgi:retron-type reverse transcriptase
MEKEYIQRLVSGMTSAGTYEEEYIKKCCFYAYNLLEKNLPVIFDGRHVDQILKMGNLKFPYYNMFIVRGKNKDREITAPSLKLKMRQRWILDHILIKTPLSNCCHGFVEGRSIVTNAKQHIGYKQMLLLDIKDFFPSIKQENTNNIFVNLGYSKSAAFRLAEICCFEGVLPQGAPTSPCLANIRCKDLDDELLQMSKLYNVEYTRYADDMAFSADTDLFFLIEIVRKILLKYHFSVNECKTRLYKEGSRKLITGILVKEDCLKLTKQFKRKLKQEIYYCKKYGASTHLENTNSLSRVNFKEYLYGKVYYLKMVEPEPGKYYLDQLDSISW